MNGRKIAFLSFVLVALVGFYYFYEVRYIQKEKEREALSRRIVQIKKDDLVSMRITRQDGSIALERRGKDWFLTEPVKALADALAIEEVLAAMENGTWEREINPLPEDLAEFGLSDPAIEVILFTGSPLKAGKVVIGAENPTKTMRYVMVDQGPRVFLVDPRFKNVLDKSADDLRERCMVRSEETVPQS